MSEADNVVSLTRARTAGDLRLRRGRIMGRLSYFQRLVSSRNAYERLSSYPSGLSLMVHPMEASSSRSWSEAAQSLFCLACQRWSASSLTSAGMSEDSSSTGSSIPSALRMVSKAARLAAAAPLELLSRFQTREKMTQCRGSIQILIECFPGGRK